MLGGGLRLELRRWLNGGDARWVFMSAKKTGKSIILNMCMAGRKGPARPALEVDIMITTEVQNAEHVKALEKKSTNRKKRQLHKKKSRPTEERILGKVSIGNLVFFKKFI